MKHKWILVGFMLIYSLTFMVGIPMWSWHKANVCLDSCRLPDVLCNNGDSNCVGGNHYCYDMCVGGVTMPISPFEKINVFICCLFFVTSIILIFFVEKVKE